MTRKFLAGIVQTDTQADKAANVAQLCAFIDEAAEKGAKLVALPENITFIGENPSETDVPETIPGPMTELLADKARRHGIYLHCGSMGERIPGEKKFYNTTVMFDPSGTMIAKYRKLHTFDVTMPDGSPIKESDRIRPGTDIVTVDTSLGKFGFSICYDIRFPEMYRLMALDGARIIFAPANFTLPTGKDHWEPILRTRAIENGCYIIAPAQFGKKPKFTAYGNSMAIDPWGTVIARAKEAPCVTIAEIDLDFQDTIRASLPGLKNRNTGAYELRDM